MAGFALSPDEIASVCHTLAAQADDVPEQVARIRSSEVGASDLGGDRYADLYRLYHEMTQETIPTVLAEHAAAGRAMADRLASTLHAYQQTDAESAAGLSG
ncbi:MAG TPA: hypothetical protein VHF06_19120 [Pseudonocardiaceae bacterium]|jgi:hypothetical protein|nr:hypothetical protein [Pseudonocardiaceae bacterium]